MSITIESLAGPRSLRTSFLLGAPRCGTTFLAKALAHHPQVCFTKPKESYFFTHEWRDVPPERWAAELVHRHCGHLTDAHTLIAEGSVLHLRDDAAVERLLRLDPETRFLVAVRNPADMVYSLHARLVYLLEEDQHDFRRAWQLQEARARGQHVPRRCRDPHSLQYRAAGKLGAQLERLYGQIDRERVHVVVFDDLIADPVKTYRRLLEFLDLPDDGRTAFKRKNENRDYRHTWVQAYVTNPPRPIAALLESRQRQGRQRPHWVRAVRRRLKEWNTRKSERPPLAPEMREELRAAFAGDIERLESLLGRDLSAWRRPPERASRT